MVRLFFQPVQPLASQRWTWSDKYASLSISGRRQIKLPNPSAQKLHPYRKGA